MDTQIPIRYIRERERNSRYFVCKTHRIPTWSRITSLGWNNVPNLIGLKTNSFYWWVYSMVVASAAHRSACLVHTCAHVTVLDGFCLSFSYSCYIRWLFRLIFTLRNNDLFGLSSSHYYTVKCIVQKPLNTPRTHTHTHTERREEEITNELQKNIVDASERRRKRTTTQHKWNSNKVLLRSEE